MLSSRPIQLSTDGAYFPTKTPGRGLKNRAENAHIASGVAMTVNGKGKIGAAPKTPFQLSSVQPERLFKGQKTVLSTITRPLGDKTPLPNRLANTLFQTPLPRINKPSKLNDDGGNEGGTPDSIQRPSSMRKHLKQPRNSGKKFETPVNNGKHWDVSDGDIMLLDSQAVPEPAVEAEDDLDEVEYGPPNTLDLPYEPPFDFELPDYKEVGRTLFQISHSFRCDDAPAPADLEIAVSELEEANWNMISLPELESDDPFHLARAETASASLGENAPIGTSRPRVLNRNTAKPITAVLKQPRSQSSQAEFGTKAPVRPASRVAPSSAVTTASVLPHHQRLVSTNSAKSTTSAFASKKTAGNLRTGAGVSAPKPLLNTSRISANLNSTAASRTVPEKVSSSTTGVRSIAKPASSVSRGVTSIRRPHTSIAFNTAKSKVPTDVKQRPAVGEDDSPLIKDIGRDLEDFDFKFDV